MAAQIHTFPSLTSRQAPALRVPARRAGWAGRTEPARGLIVDLDDTLYPRERFIRSGFAAVAADLQQRLDLPVGAVFKTLSYAFANGLDGREFQAVCTRFELPESEIPNMLRAFRAHKPSLWLPYESAEALRRLRADGWRIAILTNGLPAVQAAKVAALALAPMVDQVIYAELVTPGGKPAPEAFAEAVARLDVPADRCVVVGDDPINDIEGGRNAGLRTVRFVRPGVRVPSGGEADIVLHDIQLLPSAARAALELVTLDVA